MADFKKIEDKIKKFAVKDDAFIWNLDEAVRYLENALINKKNIYITFSGKELYSLLDDRNSCYEKVTGEPYEQFEMGLKKEMNDFAIKKMKIDGWVARGKEVIAHSEYENWVDYVYENADVCNGNQIENALKAMEKLAKGSSFEDVSKLFDNDNYGGANFALAMNILKDFCHSLDESSRFKGMPA